MLKMLRYHKLICCQQIQRYPGPDLAAVSSQINMVTATRCFSMAMMPQVTVSPISNISSKNHTLTSCQQTRSPCRIHFSQYSSVAQQSSHTEPTSTQNVKHKPRSRIPLVNWFYEDLIQGRTKINAFYLYADITKQIDYMLFFKTFDMPDTFNSWFLITELHVWMLMARLRNEGKGGKAASSCLVTALYDDSTSRSKALSPGDSIVSKKQVQTLSLEFKATLFVYDEGMIGTDTQLASALWFRFFGQKCDDPRLIELLVAYVRYQMQNLENTNTDSMLADAKVTWKPLVLKI